MSTHGLIDAYDDVAPLTKVAELIPDFVKGAKQLTKDELASLPDRAFAVVVVERTAVHRKWPLVDPAHVWLAAFYWKLAEGSVADGIRAVAACSILDAAALMDVMVELPFRHELETMRAAMSALPAHNVVNLSAAGTRSTEIERTSRPPMQHALYKESSAQPVFALPREQKYPIHTQALLKTAMAWFTENERDIEFADRFLMARNMIKQAEELGSDVHPDLWKYAECDVHDLTESYIRMRLAYKGREGFPKHGSAVIDKLTKLAVTGEKQPEQLMRVLSEFDKMAGLACFWGKALPDPAITFAAGSPKIAGADDYVAELDGVTVTGEHLRKVAEAHGEALDRSFGVGTARALHDYSTMSGTFHALPKRHQRAIVGMA